MKRYALVFLGIFLAGVAGLFLGAWIVTRHHARVASNNVSGVSASSAAPLGLLDAPPTNNALAWRVAWQFADSDARIAAMMYDWIGPQWRKEMIRTAAKLDRGAPLLVEAGIPIGLEWLWVRKCVLASREDHDFDVATCVRESGLPNPAPEPASDSEKRVATLIHQHAVWYAEKSATPSTDAGVPMTGTHDDVVAAALAWPGLRPYFRNRLVYVVSDLERQSRSNTARTSNVDDDHKLAAVRQCILAAQLKLDADVASCARDAMAANVSVRHSDTATVRSEPSLSQ